MEEHDFIFPEKNDKNLHICNLIQAYKDLLEALEVQSAKFGADCPPHISIEIREIKSKIEQIEQQIARNNSYALSSCKMFLMGIERDIEAFERTLPEVIIVEQTQIRLFGILIFSFSRAVSRKFD